MPKTRILAAGSVAQFGGLGIVLLDSVRVAAYEVKDGEAVPVATLDSDDHFAEIISHDPINLRLNVAQVTSEGVEEMGGVRWNVRNTYDANGGPVKIPLSKYEEPEAVEAAPADPAPAALSDTASPEPQLAPEADDDGPAS